MRFGDIVTCVALSAVIIVLVSFPLGIVLVQALGFYYGPTVSSAVSILISTLVVGYLFAGKIWEARMEAIGKIIVLGAVLVIFYTMQFPLLADWTLSFKEAYQEWNPGTTLSTSEWYVVEGMAITQIVFINVVMVLVLGFAGLYVGSMFGRPVKTEK